MMEQNTIAKALYRSILRMDKQLIPYNSETVKPRKKLMELLNNEGYTVGIGKGHTVVLKTLPKVNPLPPCNTNF